MRRDPLLLLVVAAFMLLSPVESSPADVVAKAAVPWDEIRQSAEDFVAKESPPSVWPFERPSPAVPAGRPNKVFAHFFLPFLLSSDNKPAADDYYSQVLLSPEASDRLLVGNGGYKRGGGGVLRQRPLPVGPWASPYWRQINFAIEILRAREMGVDGFTCDILTVHAGPLWDGLLMLMDTAAAVAPDFPIVLMPDMSSLKNHTDKLEDALVLLARRPAAYHLADGRLLISAFDGQSPSPQYWKQLLANLARRGVPAAYLPVFLGYGDMAKNGAAFASLSYGMSDWGFRDITFARQFHFQDAKKLAAPYTSVWMMPVASQDVRPKDLIAWEPQNTRAFRYLWDAAISGGSQYVQLVTWNDYSEAAEVSPSSDTQYLFYDLGAYYAAWFKTGRPPRIEQDAIYYCHRSQIIPLPGGAAKQNHPFTWTGKTPFENKVEMVAMLTAPATLEIDQGGGVERHEAQAGLTAFSVEARVGRPVFRIVRNGQAALETTSAWKISDKGIVENPIYFGGSSTRPWAPSPDTVAAHQ
jgi:hypothetical protein